MNQRFHMGARRAFLHAVQTFAREGHEQEATRGNLVDAARAQVEESVFFDLANGGAVGALDVVGVDFKLGLGIDLRLIGEKQVAISLLRVGLLGVFMHHDAAVEYPVGLAVEDAVVELAAAAMSLGMLDEHVIVEVLPPGADKQAVDEALAAFAVENRMNVVAYERSANENGVRCNIRAAALFDAQRRNVVSLHIFALDHVVRDHGIVGRDQLSRRVAERRSPAEGDIIFDDGGLAALFRDDQVPRMNHGRRLMRRGDEQQVNRRFEHCAFADVNEGAVLDEGSVERGEGVALDVEIFSKIRFYRFRMFGDRGGETRHRHAFRQFRQGRKSGRESPVHKNKLARRARHTEGFDLTARGNAIPAAIQLEICLGDGGDIRKAPVLIVRRGEACLVEAIEAALPKRPEPRGFAACAGFHDVGESFRVVLKCLSCCRHFLSSLKANVRAVACCRQAGVALALRAPVSVP